MPKLSEEAMAARRAHIIDAAERCFAQAGYRATSIPDICKAAGISVGALYTHFASKEAIVEAMAEASMQAKLQSFQAAPAKHSLRQARYLLDIVRQLEGDSGQRAARLDLDLWSEATRNPRLAKLMHASMGQMLAQLQTVVRQSQSDHELAADLPARGVAHVLLAVGLGLEVQRALGVGGGARGLRKSLSALLEGRWRPHP